MSIRKRIKSIKTRNLARPKIVLEKAILNQRKRLYFDFQTRFVADFDIGEYDMIS
jgi:hypothetical protein